MNDNDIFNFFNQFKSDTKETLTRDYIEGRITKEEYIRRMKNCQER